MSKINQRILDKLQDYSKEVQEYVKVAFNKADSMPEATLAEEMKAVIRRIIKVMAKGIEQ